MSPLLAGLPAHYKADLLLLLVSLIWGTTFVLTKNALLTIGPCTFLGLRFIIAFIFLYLVTFRRVRGFDRIAVFRGLFAGSALLLGYLFQTLGLKYTTASNAGFITGLSAVIVPIIMAVHTRTLPGISTLISSASSVAGLYLLTSSGPIILNRGDLMLLICAFGFALHIFLVGQYSGRSNPVVLTLVQILFVGLTTLAIGLLFEDWPPMINAPVLEALIITSVPATALAYLIQNGVQQYTTPVRTAIIFITEPVFAAGFAYLWTGETLTVRDLIGCSLIVTGMLISELNRTVAD